MNENTNMTIWEQLQKPPETALKEIKAGRLRGKTDINPQWRLQAMTEVFGVCGIGWKYTIDRLWLEPGSEGQVCAFAAVSIYIMEIAPDKWSAPIPGVGGSMLITKEHSGLYTSDEAYKMAITDALSVAFKAIGMAAEVYLGNFDGTKYRTPDAPSPASNKADGEQKRMDQPSVHADAPLPPPPPAEPQHIKRFFAILGGLGLDEWGKEAVKRYICKCCSVDSTKLLTDAQIVSACKWAEKFTDDTSILNYTMGQVQ